MSKKKSRIYSRKLGVVFWVILVLFSIFIHELDYIGISDYLVPQIEIAVIFFVSIYLSIYFWQIFLYGIFMDVLSGQIIGSTPFVLLIIAYIIGKFSASLATQNMKRILLYFLYVFLSSNFIKFVIISLHTGIYVRYSLWHVTSLVFINLVFYLMLHLFMYNKIYLKSYEN